MSNDTSTLPTIHLSTEREELLRLLLEEEHIDLEPDSEISRREDREQAPLSFAQQRLWFLDQLELGNPVYNIPSPFHLEGDLRLEVLVRALGEVVRRHEILRTVFAEENQEPVQKILPEIRIALPIVDLEALPPEMRETEADTLANQESLEPFELATGPLLRTRLLRLAPESYLMLFTMHHIVSDGWSSGVLVEEAAALYEAFLEGHPSPLAELPIQFGDFAAWQRSTDGGETREAQLEYWTRQLQGLERLELPTDRPRPAFRSSHGAGASCFVPEELADRLKALATRQEASLFMVLLAAFAYVLSRYARQHDVAVGSLLANRTRVETEGLIGFFVNTLVLRLDLANDPSFHELVGRVREVTLEAYAHQDLPFEAVVDALQPERDLSHTPLFQTLFVLQNAQRVRRHELPGVRLLPHVTEVRTAKFDLNFAITDVEAGLDGSMQYSTDLFEGTTIARLLAHFERVLEVGVASPDQPLVDGLWLSEAERHQVLVEWNDATDRVPMEAVDLGHLMAPEASEAVALVDGGRWLSQGELEARARSLAARLAGFGIGPESRVAVCLERSIEQLVALLGIWRAGAAYVPLDPAYPEERLRFLVEDSGAALVLAPADLANRLPEVQAPVVDLDAVSAWQAAPDGPLPLSQDLAAYVIYTSGSTGRPKGVVVSRQNVARLFDVTRDLFRFGSEDVWSLFHSFAFDFSVWELWGGLATGGRVVLVGEDLRRSPEAFAELLERERVTVLSQTPSAFRQLDGALERLARRGAALRRVVFGGEALEVGALRGFWQRHPRRPLLVNMYGITETTVHVTYRELGPEDLGRPSTSVLGRALADLETYVLDPTLRPVPLGVGGELHVGGAGVARGYLGRAALTAERFVPDPFSGRVGARLYRSGDLCRVRTWGELEYLGRIDHQVKVRGFRIESGEVESALMEHPGVREAVVVVGSGGEEGRLVAYFTRAGEEAPTVESLRRVLKERLPDYMVPAAFVALESLPLTAHGKVDRQALPAAAAGPTELGSAYVAPVTPEEELLAGVWAQVLGVGRVGVHDNFFALGGDSMLSVQVVGRAREQGLEVALQELFRHQTVADLAPATRWFKGTDGEFPESAPFELISEADREALPEGVVDAYPMTRLQLGMTYQAELDPDSPMYHNINSWRLQIEFDREKMEAAIAAVVARHPILRTSFHVSGYVEPMQVVHRQAGLPVRFLDFRHLSPTEQAATLDEHYNSEELKRFDLLCPPLIRFFVHQLSAEEIQFSITENHAIFDGWSLHATLSEIFERYLALVRGESYEPAPVRTTFRDFVALEREALESEEVRGFWRQRIASIEPHELPSWGASKDEQERRVRLVEVDLPATLREGLEAWAQRAGVPLKSVLLAVHVKALHSLGTSPTVVTGLVTNGRPEKRLDADQIRGLFLNVVPFVHRFERCSWVELARQVFEHERQLLPYRRYPFPEMQREYGQEPLLRSRFTFIHFHVIENLLRDGGVGVVEGDGRIEHSDMDLATGFWVSPVSGNISLSLRYDTQRLSEPQMRALAARYMLAFETAVADPEAEHRSLLSAAERRQVLEEWNAGEVDLPAVLELHGLIESQVGRSFDAVAVESEAGAVSYGELDARAGRLAHTLRRHGVRLGTRVALALGDPLDLVIARLAVLKAGGTFGVLDLRDPAERLEYIFEDLAPALMIGRGEFPEALEDRGCERFFLDHMAAEIAAAPARPALGEVAPEVPAHVFYTSGSSGMPKGIAASHRNIVNYFTGFLETLELLADDVVLQIAAPTFDPSIRDTFAPLMVGGRVVLPAAAAARDPKALVMELERRRATVVLSTVPTFLRELLRAMGGSSRAPLRLVLVAGEILRPSDCTEARAVFGQGLELINQYGPTECTVISTHYRVPAELPEGRPVPIGRPLHHCRVYVLDRVFEPVPPGTVGEIVIGGPGVTSGWLSRPRQSAEGFVPDPFGSARGGRLYRTGDLGRHLSDGTLEFHGRTDRQAKLRGLRLEPEGIETLLVAHPEIAAAVVAVCDDPRGEPVLVAYTVALASPGPDAVELRRLLAQKLPESMVPSHFIALDALPRLPNGKIDRGALPAPEAAAQEGAEHVPPRNEVERVLVEIWAEVMQLEGLGVTDNFFDIGGHSLIAIRLVSRMRESLQSNMHLTALFEYPTIEALAKAFEEGRWEGSFKAETIERLSEETAAEEAIDIEGLSDQDVDSLLDELLEVEGATR